MNDPTDNLHWGVCSLLCNAMYGAASVELLSGTESGQQAIEAWTETSNEEGYDD